MDEAGTQVTLGQVRQILAQQMPGLAGLPLRAMAQTGTDNRLFRLGEFVLRFPRHAGAEAQLVQMRPLDLPFPVPVLRAMGEASALFPRRWGVLDWLPGRVPQRLGPGAARELAQWVTLLRQRPAEGRDRAVFKADGAAMRAALPGVIASLGAEAPSQPEMERLVARAEAATPLAARIMEHGDLHLLNLLVRGGRMAGVLDWDGMGVGEGSADLLPAFMAMELPAARIYFEALGARPAEVERAFALALHKCLAGLPWYHQRNPRFHAVLRATLSRLRSFPAFP